MNNENTKKLFRREQRLLNGMRPEKIEGRVRRIVGLVIETEGLSVPVGTVCRIHADNRTEPLEAEVVGFREDTALLMPFNELQGVRRNDPVETVRTVQTVGVGPELLGRVVDARGRPIDDEGPLMPSSRNPVYRDSPHPLQRPRIDDPLSTGVKSIDGLHTIGRGQRIGLFSGSGVGKSVLLGMIARYTEADVNVIALVGERGREVRDFIEKNLSEETLEKTVLVVSTSDESPLKRVEAPFTASAIAEYFRDQGNDVLLLMDSLTRMCYAQREIGLSTGEPPATRGYPPSVFDRMPKLLERAGTSENGSITGIYTVLVEADDIDEPVSDTARSILDGHIWLERELAEKGHYPAVDPVQSISRLMIDVASEEQIEAAQTVKRLISTYREAEDLINIGAYVEGSNPEIDVAVEYIDRINEFLTQEIEEGVPLENTVDQLVEIGGRAKKDLENRSRGAETAEAAKGGQDAGSARKEQSEMSESERRDQMEQVNRVQEERDSGGTDARTSSSSSPSGLQGGNAS